MRRSAWFGSRCTPASYLASFPAVSSSGWPSPARSLSSPPLVLMDEPLSNLDAKLRLEMRAEIRRIHNMLGTTTIYVTHDQDEALSLADRVVVMRAGKVRPVGTPAELYARPSHADVAEFMGYRNLLRTRAASSAGEYHRVAFGDAHLHGVAMGNIETDEALVAIRPEDLVPLSDGPIGAVAETSEYRGRSFFGTARTSEGHELFFRSDRAIATGEVLRLGADPAQMLIYSAAEAA
jgi:putative spermidine/putrescine transport system ATP-binding protein